MQYESSLARCVLHRAVELSHSASNTADDSWVAPIVFNNFWLCNRDVLFCVDFGHREERCPYPEEKVCLLRVPLQATVL